MMQATSYFSFRHNSFHTRGFTWAFSIRPRSEVAHMHCPECGAVDSYPSGAFDVAVEGGTKYPDVLGCGAYPFLIVSDRVVGAWAEANISSFHTFPVGVFDVKSRKLAQIVPPSYFRVEIDGRCRIDLVASGVQVLRVCPLCGRVVDRPTFPYAPRYQMVPDSWDGRALFRDEATYPRVSFCTQLVLDLASQHHLTNFRFERMDEAHDPASKGVPYLA
jgi:hypothetical protein